MKKTATDTRTAVSAMLKAFVSYIADRENLYDYNRTEPYLFEDEIRSILRECVSGSEILCGMANETEERFYVYHNNGYGITCVSDTDKPIQEEILARKIYDYLENPIGWVYINCTDILNWRWK